MSDTPVDPPAWLRLWRRVKPLLPLNWKAIVVWFLFAFVPAALTRCDSDPTNDEPLPAPPVPEWPTGWVPPTEEQRAQTLAGLPFPVFADTPAGQADDLVAGADGDAPLWRLAAKGKGVGLWPTRDQLNLGSCVGFGFAGALEVRLGYQVSQRKGPPQDASVDMSPEWVYGGSRVDVGRGRLRGQDGSTGAWAIQFLQASGALARGVYGPLDLTRYDVARCRQWGDAGVPADLRPVAARNKVTGSLVRTADEAEKAIRQGYPIAVCSMVGFGPLSGQSVRDGEGYLRRQGQWGHCMYVAGYRAAPRPAFLIVNSWGTRWVTGPKGGQYPDIPDGAFWADRATVGEMLAERDSYAISDVGGFPRRKIDPRDWEVNAPPAPGPRDVLALARR